MYLYVRRRFRIPSGYHYIMIIVTILLPVIGTPIIDYFGPDCLVMRSFLYVVAFFLWSAFVVLAVASMLERDRSEVAQLVEQQVGALPDRIRMLEEEHGDLRANLPQEVGELVRSTFEAAGIVLPPQSHSISANPVYFNFSVPPVSVTVVRGSRMARFRQRLRRAMRQLWEGVYGKPEGS